MRTRLSSKGQLVFPRALRERDGLEAGLALEVHRARTGEYRLIRARNRNAGLVDRLLACPVKDFFRPIESESESSRAATLRPTR
jgi:bifunctional DNA-binding transcriptional regulator/antitoxin component of YhaV-PrlF toxin-antitoxin module